MACLRLLTGLPEPPLRNDPAFHFDITSDDGIGIAFVWINGDICPEQPSGVYRRRCLSDSNEGQLRGCDPSVRAVYEVTKKLSVGVADLNCDVNLHPGQAIAPGGWFADETTVGAHRTQQAASAS